MSASASHAGSPSPRPRLAPIAPPLASTPISSPAASASARRRGYTPSIAPSIRSPGSVSGHSLLQLTAPSSSRYRSFSAAHSQAGSLATTTANTTTAGGPSRFKRNHARKRGGAPPVAPALAKSANPDDVDLLALEDPDEIFRAFGVRDVRKIEQRASEAAAAKVAELRAMVGERYRDLLAAADSIVRMRTAADNLVERLESAEDSIVRMRTAADNLVERLESAEDSLSHAGAAASDASPSQRRQSLRSLRQLGPPHPDQDPRSLSSSSTTVAHTVQLLLAVPSLIHARLDAADYLGAARLEELAQVVYRILVHAEVEPSLGGSLKQEGEEAQGAVTPTRKRKLTDVFPLIEKQAEPLAALGPLVLRRALVALHDWEADTTTLAHTLAAIVMLRHTDASAALSTLLDARSRALDELLQSPAPASTSKSQQQPDSAAIAERLFGVLALVLKTVDAAYTVFAAAGPDSLCDVLQELEQQQREGGGGGGAAAAAAASGGEEAAAKGLPPILASFPNAAVLQRQLPPSIIEHCPSVSTEACSPSALRAAVEEWTGTATKQIIRGFSAWISSLSEARALADLRQTGRRALAICNPSSSSSTATLTAHELQSRLERAIEARLAEVYRARLGTLVARVRPLIEALLLALPGSAADTDPATFLFESPLAFPSASSYAPSSSSLRSRGGGSGHAIEAGTIDPFESFLVKVGKRVDGRSPLLDRGVTELEDAAREIRVDLDSWLQSTVVSVSEEEEQEGDARLRKKLRDEYVVAAGEALAGIADAIGQVVQDTQNDVNGSLFLGNLVFILSTSPSFATDLLLADSVAASSSVLVTWQKQLEVVHQASLVAWRSQTVEKATARLRESLDLTAAQAPEATLWAWESSRNQVGSKTNSMEAEEIPIPSSPSNATLAALTDLTTAVRHVGLHRSTADPAIASSLVDAFVVKAVELAADFADVVEAADDGLSDNLRREIAIRVAWDLTLLVRLCAGPSATTHDLRKRFENMASPGHKGALDSETLDASVLDYLRRAQSILGPILPQSLIQSVALAAQSAVPSGAKAKSTPAINRLLPLGPAVSAFSAVGDLHGAAAGLVKPGPRLGLLPTRG